MDFRLFLKKKNFKFTISLSVLSATYVATLHHIPVCYQQHILPYYVISLCAISDICRHITSYPCVLSATYIAIPCAISVCCRQHMSPLFYQFEFCGPIQHRDIDFYTAFDGITWWEWGFECCCFHFVYRTFCAVWMMFLLKNWPFYLQFGCKYDRPCIWDGIIYHFINFRNVWKLESDSFNNEILAGKTIVGAWSSP